ncbi:ABC transporter substrate-binding protein [Tepidibacter thalassicus]|uniref:Spermidine/putrescine transport system substrate-binding protein n=1 Tax=Tepidibacter thalassicus DSM 15285 TaxID=1123350 RepID=A0A1M5P2I6_9FIRM|nr:spermidine/putrescine ABC transporter substrate-binding protein [Tepidibacter thalassicus]SHG96036.1 spermidine/putrescine transport system substrate-binding protein [Tepidibacter thalassicus DSM 15285]
MKKILTFFIAVILIFSLTACGEKKAVLNVYNAGDYIDPQVLKDFEKEFGIKINYEEYGSNEEMLAKVQAGGTAYDVIVASDYMIQAMIRQGLLEEIDMNSFENYKNIGSEFKNLAHDPENKYSVPYFWGTMGIIYDPAKVDEKIDSWSALWNPKYKGQIIMLDSPRDTIGVALKKLGYSFNTRDLEKLEEAKKELIKQRALVKAYAVDAIKQIMLSKEAAIALAWSGDGIAVTRENPNLKYIIPKEGTNLWFDCFAVPTTTKQKENAKLFINYMMRPDVAAKCSNYVGYSTANKEGMKLLPKDLRENESAYPKGNIFEKGEIFEDLGDFTTEYDRIWTEIKSY